MTTLDADQLRSLATALDTLGKVERDSGIKFVGHGMNAVTLPDDDTTVTVRRSETAKVDPGDGGRMIPVYLAELGD